LPSKHDPAQSLADIIDNAERIADYIAGTSRSAFAADGKTRDAVERCLERVCEAAYRLGDRAAALMPDQPWGDIRGMGNRLRHGYDRLNLDVVWHAVHQELPGLEAAARQALQRLQVAQQLPPADPDDTQQR
jgi:uncharacterized protein with HEPN domain